MPGCSSLSRSDTVMLASTSHMDVRIRVRVSNISTFASRICGDITHERGEPSGWAWGSHWLCTYVHPWRCSAAHRRNSLRVHVIVCLLSGIVSLRVSKLDMPSGPFDAADLSTTSTETFRRVAPTVTTLGCSTFRRLLARALRLMAYLQLVASCTETMPGRQLRNQCINHNKAFCKHLGELLLDWSPKRRRKTDNIAA